MGNTGSEGSVRYIAALCHWRNGGLEPFDSTAFTAATEMEAKRKAAEWAAPSTASLNEKTWLQVTRYSDGYCIQSIPYGEGC
jgi:hypothetical protein